MTERFVYVVEGLGFGELANAWATCAVFATEDRAKREIAAWKKNDLEDDGFELEYRICCFPLVQ
jgi:hypothetical protein